jgi:AAA domain/RepB DNA-primase from phage plasmid
VNATPGYTKEQLLDVARQYQGFERNRVTTEQFFTVVHKWDKKLIGATLDEVERQINAAPALAVAKESAPVADTGFEHYRNYVSVLGRPGDTLCIVGILHNKDKGKESIENDFVPYEKAVTREYYNELKRCNDGGASIYVATNTYPATLIGGKTGRTQENVVEVRAVQADVDYNSAATINAIKTSASVPPPSIIVESSPGKFQGIWLVDGVSKDEAGPLMKAIAAHFQTDSAVAEIARIMRVPGFVNRKYETAPLARTLVQTNARYHREDFKVHVTSTVETKPAKSEDWYKDVVFQHKQIYTQMLEMVGWFIRVKNIKDPDVLFSIIKPYCDNAVDVDGRTPYHCDMDKVRSDIEKWCKDPKFETGDEYKARTQLTMSSTRPAPTAQTSPVVLDTSNWRSMFRSVGQMEKGEILEVIRGVLQEGTCFIGGSPGDGKSLVALAFAKAISTGNPLFGIPMFSVDEKRHVVYLIPESRDRAFRQRCEDFRMPDDEYFLVRTASLGPTLPLDDPFLLRAVQETKPVVFLDTAVRFMKSADENSAAQNKMLVDDVIRLLQHGAVAVVLIHHATKASQTEAMTWRTCFAVHPTSPRCATRSTVSVKTAPCIRTATGRWKSIWSR